MEERDYKLIEKLLNEGMMNDLEIQEGITLKMLNDYYIEKIERENKANAVIQCPVCGSNNRVTKYTFSNRYVKFLLSMLHLVREEQKKYVDMPVKDIYIHYQDVIDFTMDKWDGTKVTSYGMISKEPWKLIEPRMNTKTQKYKKDGYFRITKKGFDFMNKKLAIPLKIIYLNGKLIKIDDEVKHIDELPNGNFQEILEHFKTF